MTYQIIYDKPALKFLRKQTPEQQRRLVAAIHKLPEQGDIKPMAGRPEEYRLRVQMSGKQKERLPRSGKASLF